MVTVLLEIILFAFAITFLMAWGYVKKQRQSEEMLNQLMYRSEKKVRKAFMKSSVQNWTDLFDAVQGTKASLFWSKSKAVVQDPTAILNQILTGMIEKGEIIEGRQKTYQWVKGGEL